MVPGHRTPVYSRGHGSSGSRERGITGRGVTDVGVNLKGTLSLSLRLLLSFSLAPGLNALGPGSICIPFAFGAFSRRFYPKRRTINTFVRRETIKYRYRYSKDARRTNSRALTIIRVNSFPVCRKDS